MKYLGIDFGAKNIGLAVSDPSESFALPLAVIYDSKFEEGILEKVIRIVKEEKVDVIVLGESKNFSQMDNQIMKTVRPFAKLLEENLKIPVYLHPEFMTSLEAERLQGKNDMHDASAAALILKSYLDTKKNKIN